MSLVVKQLWVQQRSHSMTDKSLVKGTSSVGSVVIIWSWSKLKEALTCTELGTDASGSARWNRIIFSMNVIPKQRDLHNYMSLQCFVKVGNDLWLVWSNQFLASFRNLKKIKHQTLKAIQKSCNVINSFIAMISGTVSSTKNWEIVVLSCILLALHSRSTTDFCWEKKSSIFAWLFFLFCCQWNTVNKTSLMPLLLHHISVETETRRCICLPMDPWEVPLLELRETVILHCCFLTYFPIRMLS